MLAATIRRSTRRTLLQYLPRYARFQSTDTVPETAPEMKEALSALAINPEGEAATTQPMNTPVDLDNMHHHIPPASSPLLQFMATMLMRHGEYTKAAKIVSKAMLHIYALTRSPPMPIVEKAIEIASPAVRNRKLKQGGGKITYVPQALNERQRTRRGLKYIIDEANKKGRAGRSMGERLARQIVSTVNGNEVIVKKVKEIHELAMVNRGALPKRQ